MKSYYASMMYRTIINGNHRVRKELAVYKFLYKNGTILVAKAIEKVYAIRIQRVVTRDGSNEKALHVQMGHLSRRLMLQLLGDRNVRKTFKMPNGGVNGITGALFIVIHASKQHARYTCKNIL